MIDQAAERAAAATAPTGTAGGDDCPLKTWHDPLELSMATRYCALTQAGYPIQQALRLAIATHGELLPADT